MWAASALLLLTVGATLPASGHTQSDQTQPAAGSSVDAGIQTVSVTFTDKVLNLSDSSEIKITDALGAEVENSCVVIEKKSLSVQALLANEGKYRVVWRTVAEDGHPISGQFSFTVTGSAENQDFVSCAELAAQTPEVIATPKAEPVDTKTTDTGIIWPLWIAGFLLAGVGAIAFVKRKRN